MNPSVKTLCKITDINTAKTIRRMMEGTLDPQEVSSECRNWVLQCDHIPSKEEQIMVASDDLLGTFGVEGFPSRRRDLRSGISYCNTGDTYDLTLCLVNGYRFMVASWGAIVETNPNVFYIGSHMYFRL